MGLFSFVKWMPFILIFLPSISYLVSAGSIRCQTEIINKRKIHFHLLSSVLCKVEHFTAALYYWLERLGPGENSQFEGPNDTSRPSWFLGCTGDAGSILHPQHSTVAGRGPLPGPESGLLSNTGKWIVQGDTHADKAKDFVGKDAPGDEQPTGTQEDCSASWFTVSGFMVIGVSFQVVSGQSSCLAHIWSDSGSFLGEGMATHSSILAWRIPWTEEPGVLQSREWQRVGHDWATNTQGPSWW